jgi:hypothetical protein
LKDLAVLGSKLADAGWNAVGAVHRARGGDFATAHVPSTHIKAAYDRLVTENWL